MSAMGGPCRHRIGRAAVCGAFLGFVPVMVAAQGPPSTVTSAVARVRLVATVLPTAVPGAVAQPSRVSWNQVTGEALASVTVSANTPYRLMVYLADPTGSGPSGSRIVVRAAGREFRELTAAGPVTVGEGRSVDGTVVVPFRIETENTGTRPAAELPVRFELVVLPTL